MATRFALAPLMALGIGIVTAGCGTASSTGYNPLVAPGTASGTAVPHFDGSDGAGPVVHRPAPRPGEGTRDAASAQLIGGGSNGPEVVHEGEGSGDAAWPGGARFSGSSGDGPELLRLPLRTHGG